MILTIFYKVKLTSLLMIDKIMFTQRTTQRIHS